MGYSQFVVRASHGWNFGIAYAEQGAIRTGTLAQWRNGSTTRQLYRADVAGTLSYYEEK